MIIRSVPTQMPKFTPPAQTGQFVRDVGTYAQLLSALTDIAGRKPQFVSGTVEIKASAVIRVIAPITIEKTLVLDEDVSGLTIEGSAYNALSWKPGLDVGIHVDNCTLLTLRNLMFDLFGGPASLPDIALMVDGTSPVVELDGIFGMAGTTSVIDAQSGIFRMRDCFLSGGATLLPAGSWVRDTESAGDLGVSGNRTSLSGCRFGDVDVTGNYNMFRASRFNDVLNSGDRNKFLALVLDSLDESGGGTNSLIDGVAGDSANAIITAGVGTTVGSVK